MKKITQLKKLGLAICTLSMSAATAQFSFTNSNNLLTQSNMRSGNSISVVDVNFDGLDDILRMQNSRELHLELQQKNGTFTHFNLGNVSGSNVWGMAAADVDHNGWVDVVTGPNGSCYLVKLFGNNGVVTTTTTTLTSSSFFVQNITFGDFNNDGWADVFVCDDNAYAKIYANDGTGNLNPNATLMNTHLNPTLFYGNDPADSGNYGSVWLDFDNDGDLDFFVAHCRQTSTGNTDVRRKDCLFVNDGTYHFTEQAAMYGIEVSDFKQTWTSSFGDIDNDGDFDLFVTNHGEASQLFENNGTGHFTDITANSGISVNFDAIESEMEDFDNDGLIDILITENGYLFYHNNGNKTFTRVNNVFPALGGMLSFAMGDMNHDGAIDIFSSYGSVYNSPSATDNDVLYLNDKNNNNFITFDLEGTTSNKGALGARVTIYGAFGKQIREVRAGDSYGTSNSYQLHFGLGGNATIDSAKIDWPSGIKKHFTTLAANQFVSVVEGGCSIENNVLPSNFAICNGVASTLTAQPGFTSYLWSTGATTQSISVTAAGNYFVEVTNAAGCVNLSVKVEVEADPIQTPVIFTTNGETEVCEGSSVELVGPSGFTSYTWSNGQTTQNISPSVTGNYTLTIQGICQAFTSLPLSIIAHPLASLTTQQNVSIPDYNNVQLTATSNASTVNWYNTPTGGSVIGTGFSFNANVISDTTFYVSASNSFNGSTGFGGIATATTQNQYSSDATKTYKMIFDVTNQCKLLAFNVSTDRPGFRKFDLYDAANNLIHTTTDSIGNGTTTVQLNWELNVGTNYYIATDTLVNINIPNWNNKGPRLVRNNNGVNYPYNVSNALSITGSDQGSLYYYYYYNMQVQNYGLVCATPRLPIVIDAATSVTEVSSNNDIALYPNPANDVLNIKLKNFTNSRITIYDNTSRIVNTVKVNATTTTVNTANLAKGIYFVEITNNGNRTTKKLIVQ